MKTDPAYELLRLFTSPIVAITSRWGDRVNGMISDGVIRASISPAVPRLAVGIHKWHLSHDMIWQSGRFSVHLLHQGQLQLVHDLGFVSGRDGDKLARVKWRPGVTGLPILEDCIAAFELRVINTMDLGYGTQFLGHVEAVHQGRGGELLTAPWFRANMPGEWREAFLDNYRKAQDEIEAHQAIEDRRWSGPAGGGSSTST